MDIYIEMLTRIGATRGMGFITFTPLLGMSDVVVRFLEEPNEQRVVVQMGVKDAAHITPEIFHDLVGRYPSHEREARMNGDPLLGSGRVFTTDPEKITFPADQYVPGHWAFLWGVDFGITHPFAAALMAWDRETDTIYVLETYRAADELPLVHSEAIRRLASEVPVAWPHDGHRRDPGSGAQLASLYKKLDLKMLPSHAHFVGGGFSTEAAVMEMQQRFQEGRLKIREDLADILGEYRNYHRKDGLLVKVRDDLLSALMKALMMKRHAKAVPLGYRSRPNRQKQMQERPMRSAPINPWTGRRISALT